MKIAIETFLSFLAIGQSLAITWTQIGCDEPWSVERFGDQEPMTIDMDAVWANAEAMSRGARDAIASLSGFKLNPSDARKHVGANSHFIWNTGFHARRGLPGSSESDMEEITGIYRDVERALDGTLQVSSTQRGYIFCGGRGLTRGRVPGLRDYPVWYAAVTGAGEAGGLGTTDYIIPRVFESAQLKPCDEKGENEYYMGKTFYAQRAGSGEEEAVIGVVLCPNQFRDHRLPVYATLDEGYTPVAKDGEEFPYISNYNSLSGTLVHEMVHVVGHARLPPPAYKDHVAGFRDQYDLARGKIYYENGKIIEATNEQKLHNPDGYRLFAEMCRSPDTKWGHPKPRTT